MGDLRYPWEGESRLLRGGVELGYQASFLRGARLSAIKRVVHRLLVFALEDASARRPRFRIKRAPSAGVQLEPTRLSAARAPSRIGRSQRCEDPSARYAAPYKIGAESEKNNARCAPGYHTYDAPQRPPLGGPPHMRRRNSTARGVRKFESGAPDHSTKPREPPPGMV